MAEEVKNSALLEQVVADLAKGQNDAVKAKLKDLVKTKAEHEKSIRQIDAQIEEVLEKHAKGIL